MISTYSPEGRKLDSTGDISLKDELSKLDPYSARVYLSVENYDPSIEVYNTYRIEYPNDNIIYVISNDDTKYYVYSFPYIQTNAEITKREFTSLDQAMNVVKNGRAAV